MMVKDDINKYLTWSNVWKAIALVWGCVWFISEQLSSDSLRDFEVNQTKKDVSEIKNIVKDIQIDIKTGKSATDDRLNILEQDIKVLKNDVDNIKMR